jgi:hypothetical protein
MLFLSGAGKELIHTPSMSSAFFGGMTKPNSHTTICQTNLAKEHSNNRWFTFLLRDRNGIENCQSSLSSLDYLLSAIFGDQPHEHFNFQWNFDLPNEFKGINSIRSQLHI